MIDNNCPLVPISINLSRSDLAVDGFINELERIRKEYGIPVEFLHLEITETAAAYGAVSVQKFVEGLHKFGYVVEMDDFGSGLSSLNSLKDIDFDVIKLDMKFMSGNIGGRGGTIISSVIRMAKWLSIPVIAEGIETIEQADYMLSIGCDYIQGYLYSRPISEEAYMSLFKDTAVGTVVPHMELIKNMDAMKFWSPESLETLIFNNYVGAAAIFSYRPDGLEIQRVNHKYLSEIGMNLTERDLIMKDPWIPFDKENREIYENMLRKAIISEDEEECETWRNMMSDCCGEERICVRSSVRMLGKSQDEYLFYAMIRNTTAEKKIMYSMEDVQRRFMAASEQANIYFWEYDIATKEMRPCFRCMRDLGLPPLMKNYPEPAIDMGVFPPDYADYYRDIMKQVDDGVPEIDTVIPLTVGRVPFHVRYTTEFDSSGRPIKAYGSATLVVDGK